MFEREDRSRESGIRISTHTNARQRAKTSGALFRTCFLLLALAATAGFAAGQAPEELLHPHDWLGQQHHWPSVEWPHGDVLAQFNGQIHDFMGQYKDLLAQNKTMEWFSTSSSNSYLGVGAEDVDSARAK